MLVLKKKTKKKLCHYKKEVIRMNRIEKKEIIKEIYEEVRKNKEFFGNTVKLAREIKGITQKDVAEELNVNPSTISKYERGLIMPSEENFTKLIEKL